MEGYVNILQTLIVSERQQLTFSNSSSSLGCQKLILFTL